MTIQLSERIKQVKPSATLALNARAKELRAEGKDIINMGVGEPDFDTPDSIKEAAHKAIHEGQTKYTPVEGILSLREAICAKFLKDNQLTYSPDQILVSTGAKQCLYNLFQAVLNPGDEAIVASPYWVSYPDMIKLAGALPVIVKTTIEEHFKMNPAQLKDAITPKTRLILINSPSNPSGVAYSKEELAELGKVILDHPEIAVVTDDIYEHNLWAKPFANIVMATPELFDQTIVLNGVSKAYAMTGWRIGYAGGPLDVIKAMKKIQGQSTSNPNSIAQAAAEEALSGDQAAVKMMADSYHKRHDFVFKRLQAISGVNCLPSDGTFYTFPDFSAVMERLGFQDDVAFAEHLLLEAGVAMVPGSAFGAPGHLRLSYVLGMEALESALDRISGILGG